MSVNVAEAIAYQQAHIADDKGPTIVGCAIFFIAFPTIVVALRFLARYLKKLPLKLDDYFTLPALVAVILLCVLNVLSANHGVGRHAIAVNTATVHIVFKLGFFSSIAYAWVHFFVKWSILLLYRRIFGMQTPWFKFTFWTIGVYVTCWTLSLFILEVTTCRPLNYFWLQYSQAGVQGLVKGRCTLPVDSPKQAFCALNSLADFALLIVPAVAVGKLKMDLNRKLGLIAIFLIGSLACAAGLVRFAAAFNGIGNGTDNTWQMTTFYNWTAIEAGIGLLCACFPVIAPLFRLKTFQEHHTITEQKLGSPRSRSNSSGWPTTKNAGYETRYSEDSEATLHEKLPASEYPPSCSLDTVVRTEIVSLPPRTRIRDSYQERRELLHPGLGDPRVVNEVYRGVAPENMGLDRDGKPLPMSGIKVKTNIECVRSYTVRSRGDIDRCELSNPENDIWGLKSAK